MPRPAEVRAGPPPTARERVAACLLAADRCWLGTHVDPDGDAIGSILGLGRVLESLGKSVVLACQDPPPGEVAFLPGVSRVAAVAPTPGALVVALDVADAGRLGSLLPPGRSADVVIDHHVSNPGFGAVNLVEPDASSTAEVVLAVTEVMGVALDAVAATHLLAGLVSDTLGFRTSSTTAASLDAARRLLDRGADLVDVTQHIFARPLVTFRLVARAVERLERHGPFVITHLNLADLDELGASPGDVRGITMLLAGTAEPAALAVLRERADGSVDISLRAKPGVDLVPVARALGGGGHPQAAGALVPGPIDIVSRRVLDALRAHIPADVAAAAADG